MNKALFFSLYRARIKDACEVMRKLVPGMSDKTDKATVFEFAARYIHFLKGFTGNEHDKVSLHNHINSVIFQYLEHTTLLIAKFGLV
jgi:hypothetical protein